MTDTDAERAAFLAGYEAGARDEWQGMRDQVRTTMSQQTRSGRELFAKTLELIGLPDLLADDLGPLQDDQDAASAWLLHVDRSRKPS